MGLVARFLEAQGISTVVLTMTPEFHRQVGIPRVAAIEYPFGRAVGQVDDPAGQRSVLKKALRVLQTAPAPGTVVHLPFAWHETPAKVNWHPPQISPIVKLYLHEIKQAGAEKRK